LHTFSNQHNLAKDFALSITNHHAIRRSETCHHEMFCCVGSSPTQHIEVPIMASELYLTEYERERQKKIEENKRLLETLGIFETRSVLDASTLVCVYVFPTTKLPDNCPLMSEHRVYSPKLSTHNNIYYNQ
jgi:hypothetical protein